MYNVIQRMKTTLIQLDENDDILSIQDKMQWNPSRRILLVVPHASRSMLRRIDLVLIRRLAQRNGSKLAISTSQKYLYRLGKLTGVKVFRTVLAAQKQECPDQTPAVKKPEFVIKKDIVKFKKYIADENRQRPLPNWQRNIFFILGTLAPIALVLALIPHAVISVPLVQTTQDISLNFSASQTYYSAYMEGRIPANLQSVTLSVIGHLPTTGETGIPNRFATGTVRITNMTEEELNLPAHLRLNSDSQSMQFQTLAAINIPAGKGQFADVPITALIAGEAGNLPPLSINAIVEPYGSLVQITNLTPTTGGTEIHVKEVSGNDVLLLKTQLSKQLQSEAISQIHDFSPPKELGVAESLEVENETETTNLQVGDPGDQLMMELTRTYQYLALNEDEIKQLVSSYSAISILPGYQQVAGSLRYSIPVIISVDTENQVIHGRIDITQAIRVKVDQTKIIGDILGKPKKNALKIIESDLEMDQPPTITFSPSFWNWMPLIPAQIVFQDPGAK